MARRRRWPRQYGLSNANQILLAMVFCALMGIALLRTHWLTFSDDVHAGLWTITVEKANVSDINVSWRQFCNQLNRTLPTDPDDGDPISDMEAALLCDTHSGNQYVQEIARGLMIASLVCGVVSMFCAMYLHLGSPSRRVLSVMGVSPCLALFAAAVQSTVVLIMWQHFLGPLPNGDCVGMTIAATIIAYPVALSMIIRWRWPGICAVPNEQQARQTRGQSAVRHRVRGAAATAQSPDPAARRETNFHHLAG